MNTEAIMMGVYHCTFVPTHKMCDMKSEPKVYLGDYVSVSVHLLEQVCHSGAGRDADKSGDHASVGTEGIWRTSVPFS